MKSLFKLMWCLSVCWGFVPTIIATTAKPSIDVGANNRAGQQQQQQPEVILQQQTFMSVLNSIEARLSNLDNIYSMQLARTLDVKLDQYNRKLESLETKMIRLEALVMLNLDKISENISTKNFKDDISRTSSHRKMDSIYEGISHRLSYIDRKFETTFDKMQEKMDATIIRLDRIEEANTRGFSDTEAGLSEIIFMMDGFKNGCNETMKKLEKFSDTILNNTKDTLSLINRYHVEGKKTLSRFHDNIIANLQYIDNKTSEHFKISDDTNGMVKNMKAELKNDFNDYANKVADMNSDIWKSTDTTEEDLTSISAAVNQTRTEIQNGVRSLLLQMGKLNKEHNVETAENPPLNEELNKKLDDNFEKILRNQEIFLESCHRLQMDESQIESEISNVLEKLIDVFEKKLSDESSDIRNFEMFLKSHDSRVKRHVHQANANIINFYQKSVASSQHIEEGIEGIKWDINGLYTLLRQVMLTENPSQPSVYKVIINKLDNMENYTKLSTSHINAKLIQLTNIVTKKHADVYENNNENPKSTESDDAATKAHEEMLAPINQTAIKNNNKTSRSEIPAVIDDDIRKAIEDIFNTNINVNSESTTANTSNNAEDATEETMVSQEIPRTPCGQQNYRDLIDIRGNFDPSECGQPSPNMRKIHRGRKHRHKLRYPIDVRSNIEDERDDGEEYEDVEQNTEDTDE